MRKNILLIIISCSAFLITKPAIAQDTLFNGKKNKIGFVAGNGIQYLGQLLGNENHDIALNTNYYYRVTFYQLQYYRSISRKRDFGIDMLIQPQYNLTKYLEYPVSTVFTTGYEVGINTGFVFRKNFSKDFLSFYLLISSGPHFVSGTPHRQSTGFLFSDNFDAGANLRLYKSLYLDIRTGIRHISNLGIKIPNAGVNNMILTEGFLVVF